MDVSLTGLELPQLSLSYSLRTGMTADNTHSARGCPPSSDALNSWIKVFTGTWASGFPVAEWIPSDPAAFEASFFQAVRDLPVRQLHNKGGGTYFLSLHLLIPPAYCLEKFQQTVVCLLNAGRSGSPVSCHSLHGLLQSYRRVRIIAMGFLLAAPAIRFSWAVWLCTWSRDIRFLSAMYLR